MYRELGFHDFPLPAGRKAPPPVGWKALAVLGCEIPEGANRAVSTDNFCVVDADTDEVARKLYRLFRNDLTVVTKTKNGIHLWFAGIINNSQNSTKKRDTRGVGGYIVVPPSIVAGHRYEFVRGHELRHIDELKPIPEDLKPKREQKEVHQIEECDPIRRIRRPQAWVARRPPAISGQGGHDQFFKVCCGLFQFFGLTMSEAMPIILTYNARCLPPFDDKAVLHKLHDAWKVSKVRTH
jgi:hypothetical protein